MSYLPLQATSLFIQNLASSHTGNTNETSLKSYLLKGGTMGPNDFLEIWSTWNVAANNANAKTAIINFGATSYLTMSMASTRAYQRVLYIYNRGATNSQVGFSATDNDSTGTALVPVITSSEDTTRDILIDFRGLLGVGTDTITNDVAQIILWKRI